MQTQLCFAPDDAPCYLESETLKFASEFVQPILENRKTATRRTEDKGHRPGDVIVAINADTGYPFAHLAVFDAYWEPLGAVKQQEAEEEGFASADEFRTWWEAHVGPWIPERKVHVTRFQAVKEIR